MGYIMAEHRAKILLAEERSPALFMYIIESLQNERSGQTIVKKN